MIQVALFSTLATWASDLNTGINAQIEALMGADAPPPVTVHTCFTEEQVAQGALDDLWLEGGPYFLLAPEAKQEIGGIFADGTDDINAIVAMYVDARSDAKVAMANAADTMRAWRRVLSIEFNQRDNCDNAGLQLPGAIVSRPEKLTLMIAPTKLGSAQVAMAVFMPFPVLDTWALGAPAP